MTNIKVYDSKGTISDYNSEEIHKVRTLNEEYK